jgi:NAD/NADP transhydrogenase alpha subunit
MNVHPSRSRRAGLILLGLLSLGDVVTIFVTDGKTPPYAVAAIVTVLGLASLFLVVRARRDPAGSMRVLIGLRIVSAVTALPAFFVNDVPAAAKTAAAAVVVLTVVGVLLTGGSRHSLVTA